MRIQFFSIEMVMWFWLISVAIYLSKADQYCGLELSRQFSRCQMELTKVIYHKSGVNVNTRTAVKANFGIKLLKSL